MAAAEDSSLEDHDDPRQQPAGATGRPQPMALWGPRERKRAAAILIGLALLGSLALVWAYLRMSETAGRMRSDSSLKQIGLAIHNYDVTYGELPKNTFRADGTPLLSWRVHIL